MVGSGQQRSESQRPISQSWGAPPISQGSLDFPGGSDGKEFACNAGDPASVPGSGRSPGEGKGTPSVLAWRIPWTEKPGGLQSVGSQSQTRPSDHLSHSRRVCSDAKAASVRGRSRACLGAGADRPESGGQATGTARGPGAGLQPGGGAHQRPDGGPRARQPGTTVWAPLGLRLPTWADLLVPTVRPCLLGQQVFRLHHCCLAAHEAEVGGHPVGRSGPLHTAMSARVTQLRGPGRGWVRRPQALATDRTRALRAGPGPAFTPAGLGATGPCCENQRTVLEAMCWLQSPADRTQACTQAAPSQAAVIVGSAALNGGWKAGPGHPWATQGLKPASHWKVGAVETTQPPRALPPSPTSLDHPPQGPHLPTPHPSSCLLPRLTSQLQSQKLLASKIQRPEPRGSEGHLGQGSGQSWTRLRSPDPGPGLAPVTLPLGATRAVPLSRYATPRALLVQAPSSGPSWSRLHPQSPPGPGSTPVAQAPPPGAAPRLWCQAYSNPSVTPLPRRQPCPQCMCL